MDWTAVLPLLRPGQTFAWVFIDPGRSPSRALCGEKALPAPDPGVETPIQRGSESAAGGPRARGPESVLAISSQPPHSRSRSTRTLDQTMDIPDLAEFVRRLPPGTKASFLTVEIPTASADGTVPSSGASPTDLPAHSADPDAAPPRGEAGLAGSEKLKKKEAVALLSGLSGRELERAIDGEFIPYTQKATGRDAGAFLVTRADLMEYWRRREAIRRGDEPAPADWSGPNGGVR